MSLVSLIVRERKQRPSRYILDKIRNIARKMVYDFQHAARPCRSASFANGAGGDSRSPRKLHSTTLPAARGVSKFLAARVTQGIARGIVRACHACRLFIIIFNAHATIVARAAAAAAPPRLENDLITGGQRAFAIACRSYFAVGIKCGKCAVRWFALLC